LVNKLLTFSSTLVEFGDISASFSVGPDYLDRWEWLRYQANLCMW